MILSFKISHSYSFLLKNETKTRLINIKSCFASLISCSIQGSFLACPVQFLDSFRNQVFHPNANLDPKMMVFIQVLIVLWLSTEHVKIRDRVRQYPQYCFHFYQWLSWRVLLARWNMLMELQAICTFKSRSLRVLQDLILFVHQDHTF